MAGGIELATMYVPIAARTDGIPAAVSKSLSKVVQQGEKAGDSMGSKMSAAMGKTLMAGAAATGAAVSTAIGTALYKGFGRLTAIDNAEGKLQGLGHTTLGTAKIMDSALASVKGTSFGLGEAATISASAVAAGIKPGQDLTRYLSLTADAATIAGTSIEEMGAVINKVQTKGKAYTLDLNQLAIRGLPIYQWLATEMGVTQEALSDMVAEGKVDSATYLAAIEKNIGGAATAGNTVSAAWANTMAAMGRVGAAALKPTFSRSANWLKDVTAGIDVATPLVSKFADTLDHRVFNQGLPKLQKFGEEGKKAFAAFRSENGAKIGSEWDRFTSVFDSLGDSAVKAWPAVKGIVGSLAEASGALGVSSWTLLLSTLELTAQLADGVLVPALSTLSSLMENNQGVITALAAAFFLFKTVPAIMARIAPSMGSLTAQAAAGTQPLSAYQRMWQRTGNAVDGVRGAFSRFNADVRTNAATYGAASGSMSRFSGTMLTLSDRASSFVARMTATNTVLGKMGAAYTNAMPGLRAYAAQEKATAAAMQASALQAKGYASVHLLAGQAVHGTTSFISRMGAAAGGVGAAGLSAMSSAASGLSRGMSAVSGALGGPVGIALIGATIAYSSINGAIQKSKQFHEALTVATEGTAESQWELTKALSASAGVMSTDALAAYTSQLGEMLEAEKSIVKNAPGFADSVPAAFQTWGRNLFGTGDALAKRFEHDLNLKDYAENVTGTFKDLGLTNDDLAKAISGTGGQFAYLTNQLDLTTIAGRESLDWLNYQRGHLKEVAALAKNVTPGYMEMADLLKIMGNEAATATEKGDALYRSMQLIAGINPDEKQATNDNNKLTRDLLQAAPIDQAKGASSELLDNGRISTLTENGQDLEDTGQKIILNAAKMAETGKDINEIFSSVQQQVEGTSKTFGLSVDDMRIALEYLGYNERVIEVQVGLQGADDVTKGLADVWSQMMLLGDKPKILTVNKDFDPTILAELDRMGADITNLPNGQIQIDMEDSEFQMKLSTSMDEMIAFNDLKAMAGVDVDVKQFDIKSGTADSFLQYLDDVEVKPGADLDIEKLKDQKTISLQELVELSEKVANPKAFIEGVMPFLNDAENMRVALSKIQDKKVYVDYIERRQQAADSGFVGPVSYLRPPGTWQGARLPKNSTGSRLPTTGPGTNTRDGILGIGSDGVPTSWVDKGEWIVNGRSSEKWDWLLGMINRDDSRLKNLPRFAEGGRNGIEAGLAAGRSVEGNKYLWGGTGPTQFDCSGFVGWLQQIVMGITGSVKRLYTTYDFFNGRGGVAGLQAGLGPAGTQFQVGISKEHMAATIAGMSAESGGAHGTSGIGGNRANAQSSQFPVKFHLPNELIDGWDSKSGAYLRGEKPVEWTEKDALALESARVAVIQAQEARDKINANDKKSQADRDQAELKVQQAELKVRELEQKRDGKSSMSNDPAPVLTGEMGDDAISVRNAEIALLDAQLARDKVYNDPESTSLEKEKADISVYSAQNSLAATRKKVEEDKDKEANGDFSLKDRLKRYGSDLVGIAVDSALEIFGVNSRWLDIPLPEFKKPKPGSTLPESSAAEAMRDPLGDFVTRSFPRSEIDGQLPVTIGAGNWVEDWLKTLPIKLYDQGGMIPHGGLALNKSGAPEPVFTAPEFANIAKIANLDTLAINPNAGGGNDYSVNINNPTFSDGMAAVHSAQRAQGRQMMRHAGRPFG
ncbi:tape measure protein [Rhodococcus sp. (in: high G+C Gram-positive bacteria)]|uniref:tape measure protein n=1 Tax=Rhodococcus sp. TaxID=1831 RepID=UPI002580F18D|nr:tape measure protein [Rhodococcus sp. (in: high G+C Gram-positive bacteria)]MBQ9051751.1 tape measure protein [Rhodococcus sp. (in: high G+C Gram-positive bacteria)]